MRYIAVGRYTSVTSTYTTGRQLLMSRRDLLGNKPANKDAEGAADAGVCVCVCVCVSVCGVARVSLISACQLLPLVLLHTHHTTHHDPPTKHVSDPPPSSLP